MLENKWTGTSGPCPLCGKTYNTLSLDIHWGVSDHEARLDGICLPCASDLEQVVEARIEELEQEREKLEALQRQGFPSSEDLAAKLFEAEADSLTRPV